MAGMLGGQVGMQPSMLMASPYTVQVTEAEAQTAMKLTAMIRGFGEISRSNLLQFLYVFGRFCMSQGITHGQARAKLGDIVSPIVKAEIERILEEEGPAITPSTAQAEMSYMGGKWIAVEQSVTKFGLGYEPAAADPSQRKWSRKSVFEQKGTQLTPERQYLAPNTPQKKAKDYLEEERKRLKRLGEVTRSLSSSFGASREPLPEQVDERGAGAVKAIAGRGLNKLVRPADEQNYLAFCATWAEVLGVNAATAGLQQSIRDIQHSTTMGLEAAFRELDKIKMQVPMAVLFDNWATLGDVKQKWTFLSTWRERENGTVYNTHEAMLAAALLQHTPDKYINKALESGELNGVQGSQNYKRLRKYLKKLHSENKRIRMYKPLPNSANPVNAFINTHFGNSGMAGMRIPGYGNGGAQLPGPPVPSVGAQTETEQTSGTQDFTRGGDQGTQVIAAIRKENEELREREKSSRKQKEELEKKKEELEREMEKLKSNAARDARRQAKETLKEMLEREDERAKRKKERLRGAGSRECFRWQDGHCRFAGRCKFEHNGPAGRGGRQEDEEKNNYYYHRGDRNRGNDNRGYKKQRRGEERRGFGPGRR